MMGWMHATRVWYLIAAAYVFACWRIPTKTPLSSSQLSLRLVAAVASSANVLISDGYHNADKRGEAALTTQAETTWLRWDYVGISSVLTSLLWLWSSNLAFIGLLSAVSFASGAATLLVAIIAATVVPKKSGHTAVKLVMATQFVGLLGYLATICETTPCARNGRIFWVYAAGLILYVVKKPVSKVFGFHEYFHTSVLAGHVTSMLCDLRNIVTPCMLCG